jgi:hypothetical protein
VEAAETDKPVLAVVMSAEGTPVELLESDVASFGFPESAARALGLTAERAEWLRRPVGTVPELDGLDCEAAQAVVEAAGEGWLDPAGTRSLLESYGIPLVPERLAGSAGEAAAAAAELGFPVVVKTAAAGAHKTESGGVELDLRDEEHVRAAVERIGAPVIVQRFVHSGTELLAGVVQDPVFGPLVAFGPGGVLAELIGEASFRIAPLTDVDAEELVLEGKAGRLVNGFRGAPAADVSALLETRCWNEDVGALTQVAGEPQLDAAMLLAIHLGYFEPDDPRASRHVDAIRASLSVDGGLLRRYTVQDDFGHMEAAFTVCTFWLVEALALIGRTDEARELFDRLLSLDNGLGLYSEDILPDTMEQTGNFPQTYSHVGLINAAFRLSRRWE